MCKYCENEKVIFNKEFISSCSWGWGGDLSIKKSEAIYDNMGLFLDTRGYIRHVDLSDCGCLESGQSIKIKFCPFCGKEYKEN